MAKTIVLGFGFVVIANAAIVTSAAAAYPHAPFGKAIAAQVRATDGYQYEARGGCGSRGGPGYRKSNGKCAGWKG